MCQKPDHWSADTEKEISNTCKKSHTAIKIHKPEDWNKKKKNIHLFLSTFAFSLTQIERIFFKLIELIDENKQIVVTEPMIYGIF